MATKPDYYIAVTSEAEEHPDIWGWELRRYSKPMEVKVSGRGYRSQRAAEADGKRELHQFLKLLAEEETQGTRMLKAGKRNHHHRFEAQAK
jgi:hypothetical protein